MFLIVLTPRPRPELPKGLHDAGIPFTALVVYKSVSNPNLISHIREATSAVVGRESHKDPDDEKDAAACKNLLPPAWVGFFSPSGVRAMRDIVLQVTADDATNTGKSTAMCWDVGLCGKGQAWQWRDSKCAAIGQTTATELRELGWPVNALAEFPRADALLAAIRANEQPK